MLEKPIQVAIIDDNKRIRFIIRETLKPEADIRICGEAGTVQEARDLLSSTLLDVVIVDISLEDNEGGLALIREMSRKDGKTAFVVLSSHQEALYADRCYSAGAKAYLSKDMTVQHLANAIRCVHRGERFVPAEV